MLLAILMPTPVLHYKYLPKQAHVANHAYDNTISISRALLTSIAPPFQRFQRLSKLLNSICMIFCAVLSKIMQENSDVWIRFLPRIFMIAPWLSKSSTLSLHVLSWPRSAKMASAGDLKSTVVPYAWFFQIRKQGRHGDRI